jgi:hypothetical protein
MKGIMNFARMLFALVLLLAPTMGYAETGDEISLTLYDAGCLGGYHSGGGSGILTVPNNFSTVILKEAFFDDNGYILVNGTEIFRDSGSCCSASNHVVNLDITHLVHVGDNEIYGYADDCCGICASASARFKIETSESFAQQVTVTPSSGPQGTTFQQPGSGFTPNNTATLHFKGPDETEADTVVENTNSDGSFSHSWTCTACPVGTYQYWAIDNATGTSSNTASFVVTEPADLSRGLVAYYPLNGNADDMSGNGNHGTVDGATLTQDRFGNQNSAYSFDGVNDYISIPELSLQR